MPREPAIPLLGIHPENLKTCSVKIYASQCSLQHYLQ